MGLRIYKILFELRGNNKTINSIESRPSSNSSFATEAVLEDKLADFWPDFPCLYDVRSPDFKNRELWEKALEELAEKLGTTCKFKFYLFDRPIGRFTCEGSCSTCWISCANTSSAENCTTGHRKLEETAYAHSHKYSSAELTAQVCAGHNTFAIHWKSM